MILSEADLGLRSGAVVGTLNFKCLLDVQVEVLKKSEI